MLWGTSDAESAAGLEGSEGEGSKKGSERTDIGESSSLALESMKTPGGLYGKLGGGPGELGEELNKPAEELSGEWVGELGGEPDEGSEEPFVLHHWKTILWIQESKASSKVLPQGWQPAHRSVINYVMQCRSPNWDFNCFQVFIIQSLARLSGLRRNSWRVEVKLR